MLDQAMQLTGGLCGLKTGFVHFPVACNQWCSTAHRLFSPLGVKHPYLFYHFQSSPAA
jgi:hypothetical protein